MGAPKKMDAFRDGLSDEERRVEDAASRRRLDRYKEAGLTDAIEVEMEWREELGLGEI
jgi:hypothetical protein